MTIAALLVSLLASLPFLFVLARRPILRRLAFRNMVRRPREALLVVVGSMLGAAIITGSFVIGDAMNASIRHVAYAHLGPADELVFARDAPTGQELSHRLRHLPRSDVDGVLPIATLDASVTASKPDGSMLTAPRSQVIGVDFAAARSFGGDPDATGMPAGPTPDNVHAAITSDLAHALDVKRDDEIVISAYGAHTLLFVGDILPRRGIAGFWLGPEQEARNVLVSPRVFDEIRTTVTLSAAPPTFGVLVSNRGGVEAGVDRTDAVKREIAQASRGLYPQVMPVKQVLLDQADATGKSFTQMFTTMGSFGVIAGLLLLVQLFVMLAAERKPELGMARAVGMRRSWLVGGFATEGWMYALAATALGAIAGIGLGWIVIALSQQIFDTEHNRFELFFVVRFGSIAEAFSIAFLIALVTIVMTSARVSRLNIIRAIREIPEPPPKRRRRWLVVGALAAALGLLWTAAALKSKEPFGLLLGPTLLVFGLAPGLSRIRSARASVSLLAALVAVWGSVVLSLFPRAAEGAPVTIYVVQGMVLVGAAVVLVALQQEWIGTALRRMGAGRLAFRLGLAYPVARRSRTALTVSMYALVVFILTFITTISHMIDTSAEQAKTDVRGGYSAVVNSSASNPISAVQLTSMSGVRAVAPLARVTGNFTVEGMSSPALWNLTAFDSRFVANGPPKLEDRGDYSSDATAWRAVLADPGLIIVDPAFLQTGGGPPNFKAEIGTRVRVEDPISGRSRVVRVAAIAPSDMFINNGALYGVRGGEALFGDHLEGGRFYVRLKPGVDSTAFASSVQARFVDNGAEASSIDSLMDEAFTMTSQMFQLFEGYLALGLLVGIAGIAVVMIRAVRERRRPIGTLRALGFPAKTIGRSFAVETGFIALQGTIIGASLALLTLYTLVSRSDAMGSSAFSVPWVSLFVLLAGTLLASLLATVAPAVSATQIRPAVALRTTD
jgi:putative ABC transport system permease protein